jgi:hypothetical protein
MPSDYVPSTDPDITYWVEALQNALEGVGKLDALTREEFDKAATELSAWRESYGMAFGHDCIPDPDGPSAVERALREQQQRHERELAAKDEEITAYRRSVALRRGVPIEDVYVDRSGSVIYGKV